MSPSVACSPLARPTAVAVRLLLWPVLIEVAASLVARTQDDPLGAGFSAFAVVVALAFALALLDGLVLRVRPLALVWSVVTVLVALLVSFQPAIDTLVDGDGTLSAREAADVALSDLPSSLVFFVLLVGVPAALGALSGSAIRRSRGARPAEARAHLG